MPTNSYIRAKLIKLIITKPDERVSRASLLRRFGPSNKDQANRQIDQLVFDEVLIPHSFKRGGRDYKVFFKGPKMQYFKCPLCSQDTENNNRYRLWLIQEVKSGITYGRKKLARRFRGQVAELVDEQISLLLTEGVFVNLVAGCVYNKLLREDIGIKRLIRCKNFPSDKCPYCLQYIPHSEEHLQLDHDHDTELARGFVCPECNRSVIPAGELKPHLVSPKVLKYLFNPPLAKFSIVVRNKIVNKPYFNLCSSTMGGWYKEATYNGKLFAKVTFHDGPDFDGQITVLGDEGEDIAVSRHTNIGHLDADKLMILMISERDKHHRSKPPEDNLQRWYESYHHKVLVPFSPK
jgi:hypothetical protein